MLIVVQSAYVHNKEVKAANGVKVVAPDLDKAIAGSKLLVCGPDDDEDDLIEEVMKPLEDLLKRVSKTQTGVYVQASTLGSLEALLSFLETSKIPVSGIQIGPVHKKDVRRAMTQLEKAQEMACILCFDVPVDKEAEKLAEESGVKLFRGRLVQITGDSAFNDFHHSSRHHLSFVRLFHRVSQGDHGSQEKRRRPSSRLALSIENHCHIRQKRSHHCWCGHHRRNFTCRHATLRCECGKTDREAWSNVSPTLPAYLTYNKDANSTSLEINHKSMEVSIFY